MTPNTCSDYKTADSRAQIRHERLKARLSQGDLSETSKKPSYPCTEMLGIYRLI
jgi:hypothetical protein